MRSMRLTTAMLLFVVIGLAAAGVFALVDLETAGVDIIAILAVAAALALGELLTAAIVGLMLATGQFLEDYAAGRAQREPRHRNGLSLVAMSVV
jgi:cation transport ATPase